MTTPAEETAGTAVGAPKRFELSPRAQALLAEKKTQSEIIARIAEMNWGKGLDGNMVRVVAAYLRRNALDVREVNILGGNIYRNTKYWLRRLSELTERGEVEYTQIQHIAADPRLEEDWKNEGNTAAMRALAYEMMLTRRNLRIQHAVPEHAIAACVFSIKLKALAQPAVGCKFVTADTQKHDPSKMKDPVGFAFPMETVETRACRRAMRYVASQIPSLAALEAEIKDDELTAGVQLEQLAAENTARETEASRHGPQLPYAITDGLEVPAPMKAAAEVPKEMSAEENLALDRQIAQGKL